MVPETGLGSSTVRHHDVPRFGALRRDNTPTPACLLYINEISNYNNCSWSCTRGRRDRPWAWFSPASLLVVMAVVNARVSTLSQEGYPGLL